MSSPALRYDASTRLLLPVIAVLLACCGSTSAPTEGEHQRPNVLFIAVDDLNDWVGVLGGHPQAHTPSIDRLARRGLLFANAHAPAPACNSSRTAIMSGLRPSTTGVYFNHQRWRAAIPDAVILPEYFRRHGYRAIGGGKVLHTGQLDSQSWDAYFPSRHRDRPVDPLPAGRPLNGIPDSLPFDWGPQTVEDEEMADAKLVDWAIAQLARPRTKPLFLACGIYRPHLPWYVPKQYFDRFPIDEIERPEILEGDLDDVPALGRIMAHGKTGEGIPDSVHPRKSDHSKVLAYDQWDAAIQGYLASIAFADAQVGRLLDALDRSEYADDTIVVLWGDHGWHLGEKLSWRKFALWEDTTRTPLIVVAPGVTRPESVTAKPVSLLDLYPTLIDLAGLPAKTELEGQSLRPLLADPQADWPHAAIVTHGRNNHAVRTERWRYIRYRDGGEELYDHGNDPHEWHNLSAEPSRAGIKEELARQLPQVNAPEALRDLD